MPGRLSVFVIAGLAGIVAAAVGMWYMGHMDDAAHEAEEGHHQTAPVGEKQQGDHHDHEGHDDEEHEEKRLLKLAEGSLQAFGITLATAGPGKLRTQVTLPGQGALNADRRAHIVPRISGVVQQVTKNLGDAVRAGEVLAVLDSRELVDVKAAYLSARDRVALAEVTFRREADLRQKKISPEQEFLEAKKALAEARIDLRTAEQKLQALGFSNDDLSRLPSQAGNAMTRYSITAPFDGTVIEKHVSLRELVKDDAAAFVIADLRTVWVNLSVYPKDLAFIRQGQSATLTAGADIPDATGKIAYVGPIVEEQTRTALARILLPNPEGHWRPGLFVTATIDVGEVDVPVLIPSSALQTVEGRPTVFVRAPEGFEPRTVSLGRSNSTHVEIISGLDVDERYAATATFVLKAELAKSEASHAH